MGGSLCAGLHSEFDSLWVSPAMLAPAVDNKVEVSNRGAADAGLVCAGVRGSGRKAERDEDVFNRK